MPYDFESPRGNFEFIVPTPSSKGLKECALCNTKDLKFSFDNTALQLSAGAYRTPRNGSYYAIVCVKCAVGIVEQGSLIKAMKLWNKQQEQVVNDNIAKKGW